MGIHRTPRSRRAVPTRSTVRVARPPGLHRPATRSTEVGQPALTGSKRPEPEQRRSRSRDWAGFGALLAAAAAIGGVVFTGLSLQATRAQNTVTEQGQITDRFTKAVDQLDRAGADHLQARLGGIYALERLAHDSPRDQPTVAAVLAAFIRSTVPRRFDEEEFRKCPGQPQFGPPPIDVQAALTVLGRHGTKEGRNTEIDLSETCLRRADFGEADLKANFKYAVLDGSDFSGANLAGSTFQGASLRDASFEKANLGGTSLFHAEAGNANFANANVSQAHLQGAYLGAARFTDADLRAVQLHEAILCAADFTGADLRYANLTETVFGKPGFLKEGSYRHCHSDSVRLSGADLRGTNFTGAELRRTDLSGAFHDNSTVVANVTIDEGTQGVWWR